jgi:hypothetical protein
LAGCRDYCSKYELGWHVSPTANQHDAVAAVELALADAERLVGRPLADVASRDTGGSVLPLITIVTDKLDRVVPAKTATNLLVATWNIRAFDRYTPTWRSTAGDSPIRDYSNIAHIAEIVVRFDVIAIQELHRSASVARSGPRSSR